MNILNYSEARDEAERLSRVTKRNVEVRTDICCDFDKSCLTCGGQGYVYVPVYSCGHVVPDGGQTLSVKQAIAFTKSTWRLLQEKKNWRRCDEERLRQRCDA